MDVDIIPYLRLRRERSPPVFIDYMQFASGVTIGYSAPGDRSNKASPQPESRHVGLTPTVRFSVKYTTTVVPSRQPCNSVIFLKEYANQVLYGCQTLAIGCCWLIQQTLSNSILWSLVIKYFW